MREQGSSESDMNLAYVHVTERLVCCCLVIFLKIQCRLKHEILWAGNIIISKIGSKL